MQLRNAPTRAMKQWGYGAGYQHAHQFEDAIQHDGVPAGIAEGHEVLSASGSWDGTKNRAEAGGVEGEEEGARMTRLLLSYVTYCVLCAFVAMGFGAVWHDFSVEFHKATRHRGGKGCRS